ncbi:hypothetical protein AKJ65_01330 [candidate division MSBL1 archaeon SCGC-AAA259E19]|uniref:SIS domain-containing protein n=1 Tax=candidate division MSBL1 archaeon SCGC-AAA259E19 TaxID=1698264 RepID=A0A133UN70_9EURY|nr:hypothetical protein AKJ65_01330 [candidate division MSBL1 archaeon SCGC-AAA259E19]
MMGRLEKMTGNSSIIERFPSAFEKSVQKINYGEVERSESFNKTVVCGLGLSGVIGRAFAIRLAHCADAGEERRVSFYKDAGNIVSREGDLAIVFSGSGQKFWAQTLKPVKELEGRVVGITSFSNSPLSDIATLCLKVPGRKKPREKGKLENPPESPREVLFEIRTFLAMETFIHLLVREDKISVRAIENKHPHIT